jgi:DNA topoisomerase-1
LAKGKGTRKASEGARATTRRKSAETRQPRETETSEAAGSVAAGRPLIIVESRAKAKTIGGILRGRFSVVSSLGHVLDLPTNTLGVDIEHGFTPEYVPIKGRTRIIQLLKKAGKQASEIYLATDPDREGEAIAAHIASILDTERTPRRIEFHEITRRAIEHALENPREINQNLVEAQQTRRVLDRIVGYSLSPILWKRLKSGLSGGRVQSATLKMVVDREREIRAFVSRPYWTVSLTFTTPDGDPLLAILKQYAGKEAPLRSLNEVRSLEPLANSQTFIISELEVSEKEHHPLPPYTTSTLQQDAYRFFRSSPQRSMRVAQELYEGVDLGRGRREGLITYMRTDSVRVANEAIGIVRNVIQESFGEDFLPDKPRFYPSRSKFAQEAHEAIRPTDPSRRPEDTAPHLTVEQARLYELIWRRFVASQMANAVSRQHTATISSDTIVAEASASHLMFEGYLKVWTYDKRTGRTGIGTLPPTVQKGMPLTFNSLELEKRFDQPPPRYTPATLVRAMEEAGIGRPSTFAPTVDLLSRRKYVESRGGEIRPTLLGELVSDFLVAHFPNIVDIPFTAQMEEQLDEIENGSSQRQQTLTEFYTSFKALLDEASKKKTEATLVEQRLGPCPLCGAPLTIRSGKFGLFAACTRYPDCKFTRDARAIEDPPQVSPFPCPSCGADLLYRSLTRGTDRFHLVCSRYPECKTSLLLSEVSGGSTKCPSDGGLIVPRRKPRSSTFFACANHPDCKFTTSFLPLKQFCPSCGSTLFSAPFGKVCLKTLCDFPQ